MTLVQGITDTALLVGGVMSVIGIEMIFEGGINGFIKYLQGMFQSKPESRKLEKTFYNPDPLDMQMRKSLYAIEQEQFLEDAKKTPIDKNIQAHHLAKEITKDAARLVSSGVRRTDMK